MLYRYIAAVVLAAGLLALRPLTLDSHRPEISSARADPLVDIQVRSGLMGKVKELGHKALKLGYTCREAGLPLDGCAAEYDDIFDKAMAGDPL